MRKTVARVLFLSLVVTSCTPPRDRSAGVELSQLESTALRATSVAEDEPADEPEDEPADEPAEEAASGAFSSIASTGNLSAGFDGSDVYGGMLGGRMALSEGQAGAPDRHMALSEGRMGKPAPPTAQDRARRQAIEHARTAGILGSTGVHPRTALGPGSGPTAAYRLDADGKVRRTVAPDDQVRPASTAWVATGRDRLSTFAADVDTASYTISRRHLSEGTLPPTTSVRVEEYLNYFRYGYAPPTAGQPFAVAMDLARSPFDATRSILRVGVSTRPLAIAERKAANLVFLVDVSGSMASPDKLDLAKRSLRILVDNLVDGDTVALVTYAGSTRVVMAPTGIEHRTAILSAIEDLSSGGGTAMGDGIELAYAQAVHGLRPGAISRVIVLSDGDANIGTTDHAEILARIAGKVKEGVTLSTIGFGMGNYKDAQMEQLANKGNGNNFYIDSLGQAKRVFQQQLGGMLEVVAKDVKLQVDFDPTRVARYRLIGYENRDLADDDFRDDRVDAGEIGAGHQVTALYELELVPATTSDAPLATVRVRHKAPTGITATEASYPMRAAAATSFTSASADLRFAFAAAAFAEVLRGSPDARRWHLPTIQTLAASAAGTSLERHELVQLIQRAIALRGTRS